MRSTQQLCAAPKRAASRAGVVVTRASTATAGADLVDTAVAAGNFKTLVAAVTAAGLVRAATQPPAGKESAFSLESRLKHALAGGHAEGGNVHHLCPHRRGAHLPPCVVCVCVAPSALHSRGLQLSWRNNGTLTLPVLAQAFAKLPAGTVDDLLKPENKAKLVDILTVSRVARSLEGRRIAGAVVVLRALPAVVAVSVACFSSHASPQYHVVKGKTLARHVANAPSIPTLQGLKITVRAPKFCPPDRYWPLTPLQVDTKSLKGSVRVGCAETGKQGLAAAGATAPHKQRIAL